MSRTRFVKGKIFDIAEKFSYHSESSIIESSAVFYQEKSETVILHGGNPENPPSADLVDYYLKIRIKDPTNYKGEFGFDWIDIDPVSEEIQKIQDVGFSDVEYYYKKGATANDLGDIIAKSTDEPGAKAAIKENYKFPDSLKPCTDGRVDRPFVLIKPNQEISLSLEVNIPKGGTLTDEKIYLTDDEFYSFEMVGGTKDAATKRAEIKISSDKEVVELKIKCLKESPEKKYTILQENSVSGKKGIPVGGFFMMENKVLKLKFRVISLVSSDGAPAAKAQALFQKFKDNKIKEYLNENSLNQAGYEVEIENQTMFDTLGTGDLDDYFYAFDKTDWTNKKYFANINKQKHDIDPATGYCRAASWDPVKKECAKIPVPTDVIVDNQKDLGLPDKPNEMDGITITEYKNKLKAKGKTYEGGVIILSDFESSDEATGAYSRTSPLNHYALMVYSSNTESKDTYAHEIGHMLGLPHLFFDTREKEAYKIARESILGNGQPEKNPDGTKNNGYRAGIKKYISNVASSTETYYGWYNLTAIRDNIISALEKYNRARQSEVEKEKRERDAKKAYYINFKDSDLVGKTQTKKEYFSIWNENIKKIENYIEDNRKAISDLRTKKVNNYVESELIKWFFKTDLIRLLNENLNYYNKVIEQVHSNYLMFVQGKTKNMMDYHNTRVVYLSNQIRIMRSDIQNYIDMVAEKPKSKKK
ncbi:zinc metalloprotease [Chryseobacterium salviniae]|uniref:Uncharacterized protein n=1 Tax=Chryseobacterium salviniae TaxID=3101750 RepID=A0ABU6HMC3_9FLAO|nr:hypothetical protein [Chryseobacterium sp. T9W2-O]MEC3874204.1 hypothetical protein [Chryseobacterium sp. T9W2-O]